MRLLITLVAVCTGSLLLAQWSEIQDLKQYQTFHHTYNEDTAFFVSYDWDSPIIYRTLDGGQTLDTTVLSMIQHSWLLDICFPSANVGYACGGTAFGTVQSPILKTSDGGQSWDTLVANRFGYELGTVHFVDEQTGFFGGSGQLIKTTDGGNTFTTHTLGNGVGVVKDLYFKNANTGFALQQSRIYKTTDGGLSWTEVFSDTTAAASHYVVSISFPQNGNTGYVINRSSGVIKTTDNGDNWQQTGLVQDSVWATCIEFTDAVVGYAGTLNPMNFDQAGRIYITKDGGQSWELQYQAGAGLVAGPVTSIGMANTQVGYAMMGSYILKTVNGGIGLGSLPGTKNWHLYPNPARHQFKLELEEGDDIEEISMLDMRGRKIQEWEPSDTYPLKQLPPGLYFIRIKSGGLIHTEKLRLE